MKSAGAIAAERRVGATPTRASFALASRETAPWMCFLVGSKPDNLYMEATFTPRDRGGSGRSSG